MRKLLLLSVLAIFIALPMSAIRPIKKLWTMTQPDGTTVRVYVHGDRGAAYYTTVDGQVLVMTDTDELRYAIIENGRLIPSDFLAHEITERSEQEKEFLDGQQVLSRLSELKRSKRKSRYIRPRKEIYVSTDDGLGKYGRSGLGPVKSIGKVNIPVIMVQFNDTKFKPSTTKEHMTAYFNEKGYRREPNCVGSVKDYFVAQSRGLFEPTFDVLGVVTLGKSYRYYGKNNMNGDDLHVDELVADAVKAAMDQGADFSKYLDGDGNIQFVSVLYAGKGEATSSSNPYLVWPQQFDFEPNFNIAGFHFNGCFVSNELDDNNTLMGMGVFCHEFGHALGLPDFYVTDYSYDNDAPFGFWSIMDEGGYIRQGRAPIGYTAYERSCLGWLDIPELTDKSYIKLMPTESDHSDVAVLIRNPNNKKEYFILENRSSASTWYPETCSDSYSSNTNTFSPGLLVTHIAYDKRAWEENEVNNIQDSKRAYVVTANGSEFEWDAQKEHLYGNGVNEIKSFSLFDGSKLEKTVYKIESNADGTLSFHFLIPDAIEEVVSNETQDNYYYDLQGRRIENPTRGIYIKNGKKYAIK